MMSLSLNLSYTYTVTVLSVVPNKISYDGYKYNMEALAVGYYYRHTIHGRGYKYLSRIFRFNLQNIIPFY